MTRDMWMDTWIRHVKMDTWIRKWTRDSKMDTWFENEHVKMDTWFEIWKEIDTYCIEIFLIFFGREMSVWDKWGAIGGVHWSEQDDCVDAEAWRIGWR